MIWPWKRQVRQNPVAALTVINKIGTPQWTPRNYAALAKEGYERNPHVYACIRLVASAAAGIPWRLSIRRNGKIHRMPDDHPLMVLIKRPNPSQGQSRFLEQALGYYLLAGNSYIVRVGPDNGRPRELYLLRPDRMSIIPGNTPSLAAAYKYTIAGQDQMFTEALILHLKSWHPTDDFYGLSPLEAAAYSVDQNNAGRAWNKSLLDNGAQPAGGYKTAHELGDTQYEQLAESLKKIRGSANAGKPMILEGDLEWVPTGLSPRDMSWASGMRLSAREIASVYGVPPELIGDHENATYSNFQEARKALYTETVLPLMDWLRDELNNWLTPLFGPGLSLSYDKDDIEALQEDRSRVWDRAVNAVKSGLITINEGRSSIGYDAAAGADELLIPATMLPLVIPKAKTNNSIEMESTATDPLTEYWRSFDHRRAGYVGAIQSKTKAQFNLELEALKKALPGGLSAVLAALGQQEPNWERLLTAIYLSVGQPYAVDVYAGITRAAKGPDEQAAIDPSIFARSIAAWIKSHAAKKIQNIGATTQTAVADQLSVDTATGESIETMADHLSDIYDGFDLVRAPMIARTEVIGASNLGAHVGAMATGLPMVKKWLATRDSRTREDHANADGQKQAMHAPFDVGGSRLQFPGDTSLGAAANEIINCRCTQTYEVTG